EHRLSLSQFADVTVVDLRAHAQPGIDPPAQVEAGVGHPGVAAAGVHGEVVVVVRNRIALGDESVRLYRAIGELSPGGGNQPAEERYRERHLAGALHLMFLSARAGRT